MKIFVVLLMTTLVCFIQASQFDESCSEHKDCQRKDLGCFEDKCQWIQNYLNKEEVRDSYYATKLGDPCITIKQCSHVPTDADKYATCYSLECIAVQK
ncbi:uncharacterized protein LOC141534894 [Cotesia typhae]|uniref:uncharacterized protein LOC141534894 n=1 Tax=Cotesia typhae TaxID=2053667 RepID=UPI003D691A33